MTTITVVLCIIFFIAVVIYGVMMAKEVIEIDAKRDCSISEPQIRDWCEKWLQTYRGTKEEFIDSSPVTADEVEKAATSAMNEFAKSFFVKDDIKTFGELVRHLEAGQKPWS